ncbi:hypothetical protein [Falsirhodobacter sp. alg1]|nr:hypothetical protein [Falsirhodobacter sp. alg1]
MGFILKLVLVLVILAFAALVAFAYVGDLRAPQAEVTQPVTLDAQ